MTQQGYPPPADSSPLTNLSVIQRISDTYKVWHNALNDFPRISRFTLGTKIDTLFLEAIELIVLASYAKRLDKHQIIVRASGKLDLVKFFLKLSWEMKLLDDKKYLAISAPLEESGKMLGGWLKQAERILQPKQNSFQKK